MQGLGLTDYFSEMGELTTQTLEGVGPQHSNTAMMYYDVLWMDRKWYSQEEERLKRIECGNLRAKENISCT